MKYIYPGATHIHTTYSDGTSDIKEIASAAKKAGLSWIIITDHNSLEGLNNDEEGWYDGVAVLIGEEISPDYSDHYLAFNIKQEISPDQTPIEYIKQVKEQGGIGFIAHPDESTERKSGHKSLRWTDWNLRGFDGIEIWNQLSDWTDNYNPKQALYDFIWRNDILSGPSKAVLDWWDQLNNETTKIVPAIGSVDLHALKFKYFGVPVKIFPYLSTFKTVTNLIYLDEKLSTGFNEAKKQILGAIKQGNSVVINRAWSKGLKQPLFYIENTEKRAFSGDKIKRDEYTKLRVKLPRKAAARVIYNGMPVLECRTTTLALDNIIAGKYRLEVYYKNKPWIFTNPVLVTDE